MDHRVSARVLRRTARAFAPLLVSVVATAQAPAAPAPERERLRPLVSPDSRAPVNLAGPVGSVEFATDDATGTARMALQKAASAGGLSVVSLILSGPLKKSQQQTALYDETGLRNATSVGLAYSRAYFTAGDGVDPNAISAVCERFLQKRSCTYAELPVEGRRAFVSVTSLEIPVAFGFTGQVGREEFKFVDPADPALTNRKIGRNAATVAAGVSKGIGSSSVLVGLSYRYTQGHKSADAAQLCRPIAGTGALQCASTALGAPAEETVSIVGLEARAFFQNAALAPKVGFDIRKSLWSLEIPLFLFRVDNGGFIGGVRATVVEGKSAIGYSVFLSRALSTQMW